MEAVSAVSYATGASHKATDCSRVALARLAVER